MNFLHHLSSENWSFWQTVLYSWKRIQRNSDYLSITSFIKSHFIFCYTKEAEEKNLVRVNTPKVKIIRKQAKNQK
jgi:hypothetical protein